MEKIIIELDNKKHEISKLKVEGEMNPIEVAQVLMQMAMKELSSLNIKEDKAKPAISLPTVKEKIAIKNREQHH